MAWSDEQRKNAAIIISVGKDLGASARDIQIALMAAMVESNLVNVNYGDRDSLGLFQQRAAWAPASVRMDPYQSARMFFTGGRQGQQGLLDKGNRNQMSMGAAAQAVQVSAFPDRYAERQDAAAQLLGQLGDKGVPGTLGAVPGGAVSDAPTIGEALTETLGEHIQPDTPEVNAVGEWTNPALAEATNPALAEATNPALDSQQFGSPVPGPALDENLMADALLPTLESYGIELDPSDVGGWRKQVINFARKMLGTPYVWGGTSLSGVDCSGLIKLAFQKAGIDLPRVSADQARSGKNISFDDLSPGDLVAIDNSSRNNGADHIGIFIGNGQVIHAPRPGASVEVAGLNDVFGGGWGVRIQG